MIKAHFLKTVVTASCIAAVSGCSQGETITTSTDASAGTAVDSSPEPVPDVEAEDQQVDGEGGGGGRQDAEETGAPFEPITSISAGPVCDPSATSQTISFVHVNDLHSSYQLGADGVSPYARLRGYYLSVLASNPYTLFTNAGDDHEKGSIAEQLSSGPASVQASGALGIDVRVIGNHDFAWSEDDFLKYSRSDRSIVLGSNITYTGTAPSPLGTVEWATAQVGCVKLGLFGMVSKPWNELDEQYTGDYYPDLAMRWDFAARAQEIVNAHRSEVDVMIMVSHLGLSDDEALVSQVDGIDVVLGGHSHSTLWAADIVNSSVVIQCGSFAGYAGRLDIKYDLTNKRISNHQYGLHVNQSTLMPVDQTTETAIEQIAAEYAPEARKNIGWISAVTVDESGIGNVTAKAAIFVHKADAAIVDQSTIWTTWPIGGLTQQGTLDTFKVERERSGTPGFNSTYLVAISGTDLATLAANVPSGWSYSGPSSISPATSYTLAVQKRPAFHPDKYFPAGIVFGAPQFASETWYVLDQYARARSSACKYVDSDSSIPLCP